MDWTTLGKVFFSMDLPTDFLGLLPFLDDCFVLLPLGARRNVRTRRVERKESAQGGKDHRITYLTRQCRETLEHVFRRPRPR